MELRLKTGFGLICSHLMAHSHCTGTGQDSVQGTGLAHWETMGPVLFQVLVQWEQFCIIYSNIVPGPVPGDAPGLTLVECEHAIKVITRNSPKKESSPLSARKYFLT